jgi:intein/homing endonuclease
VKAFLEGVIAGDGYIHNQGRRGTDIEIKTVSRTLALQLHMIAMRLGYYARIYEYPAIDDRVIKGRHVSFKNIYRVDIRIPSRGNGRIRFTNDYALIPVETVERRHYRGYVYNLETEKHIYLANNIIVHNCRQVFSALNINWGAGDTLQVTWKVQVKQAT